jgi:glycosyltransferase involved in cell wall biosynthesis
MNILTALYTMRRGGSPDRFKSMMEAFLERGCKVHCLSLTPIRVNHQGYTNHVFRIPAGLQETVVAKMVVLSLFPLYVLWIGLQEKIDLFIAFGTLYAFIEGIPKWILRKPMVTFLRGNFSFGMRMQGQGRVVLWLNWAIERVGIHLSDAIVSVNSTLQEEMRRTAGGRNGVRWEILPNNIPPMPNLEKQGISVIRERYGISNGAKVLATAGVITRGKNLELLIRSLPEIGLENLFLLVAGDAATKADFEYHAFLKGMVNSLNLGNRVIFTGWLEKEELWKIFYGVDLFVLPSKSEGMPNAMLEALGCELICFGSNIPGIRDILQYDELLFDPIDQKTLVNRIRNVFSDSRVFDEMERLCRERRKAFLFDWKERVFEVVTQGFEAS